MNVRTDVRTGSRTLAVYRNGSRWKHRVLARIRSSRTLRIVCYCGVAGVLVDLDHAVAWFFNHFYGADISTRFFHTPLLVASGVIIIGLCTYLAGLHIKLVLKQRSKT